jgi:hypothetical protein
VEEFLGQVARQVPQQLDVARRLIETMQRMVTRSGGTLTFALRSVSASLYYASPSGPKRFLSLRTDGRFRLVLVYIREAGLTDLLDRMIAAAPPALAVGRADRAAGIRYVPAKEQAITEFLQRVEQAIEASQRP